MIAVSVIVPNYNHASFLKQRIESILSQTFQDFELIILDDCSTDNSREIIEEYRKSPKVKHIVFNDKNSGSTFKQWQKGIELARGELIWIAESDDWCDYELLETLELIINKKKEISVAYCLSEIVDVKGNFINGLGEWYKDLDSKRWESDFLNEGKYEIRDYLSVKNTIPNASAVLFKKKAFAAFGKVPSEFKLSGDWIFWIKMIQTNKIAYTTRCRNYFRLHKTTVRKQHEDGLTILNEKIKIYRYLLKNSLVKKKVLIERLRPEINSFLKNKNLRKKSDRSVIINVLRQVYSFNSKLSFQVFFNRMLS